MNNKKLNNYQPVIAVIGLGYVGLPLAVAFASKYKVIGFDVNQKRLDELREGNRLNIGNKRK
jgi:UDP-N-acetyl-D-galactosamine dehydrogenase